METIIFRFRSSCPSPTVSSAGHPPDLTWLGSQGSTLLERHSPRAGEALGMSRFTSGIPPVIWLYIGYITIKHGKLLFFTYQQLWGEKNCYLIIFYTTYNPKRLGKLNCPTHSTNRVRPGDFCFGGRPRREMPLRI